MLLSPLLIGLPDFGFQASGAMQRHQLVSLALGGRTSKEPMEQTRTPTTEQAMKNLCLDRRKAGVVGSFSMKWQQSWTEGNPKKMTKRKSKQNRKRKFFNEVYSKEKDNCS